ncbi:MAG: nucleoside-diphosphate sugar epimerase/dehydratase [Clostridium sp.]|nr:nucleoside-diphosphate sugar epimerase/dehydratase [Clostridium sp.]
MSIKSYIQRKKNEPFDQQLLIRRILLIMYDILAIIGTSGLTILLRFNLNYAAVELQYIQMMWKYLPINIICTLVIFMLFKLYSSIWQYAGPIEAGNVVMACGVSVVVQFIGYHLMGLPMFRSYYILYVGILMFLILASRFAYRFIRMLKNKRIRNKNATRIMIVGAGESCNMLIKEITNSSYINGQVKCLIDDDPAKIGKYVQGIKVVGDRDTILHNARKYEIDEIIIALPSASKKSIKEITNICKESDCELKILPGMYQLVNGEVGISNLRNVEVEDLLGREPISVNVDSIAEYVRGKVVLVTGGGGSIGSELCRQIARHIPKQLIILDIYENNAYDIKQELEQKYPRLNLLVLIGSVRNTSRVNWIFEKYRPDIVYHAAAHKHVPLMEDSPNEAIKNNVFGTLKTVQAADRYGTQRFVLISTDKAVNPTNIMGASKRMCEMIVQMYDHRSKTEFVAVRFGNVLGSNGSVIPLFKKQIAHGGPVTVTHPDIIRYFMTIPEAVSLVIEAGLYAKGGEIFVLDMGEPVKILDLAENLIRLSGYTPYEDIQIRFTGLRPGEKLYEELLMDEEGLTDTENKMIHIGKPIEIDEDKFIHQLEALKKVTEQEPDNIRKIIKEIVPTYNPQEQK